MSDESAPPIRKIIHIDMDAFYASVEQRDHPKLRGRPVAVGGSSVRGVVAAASYEARIYGVKSAMPSSRAIRQCPHLMFVKPRFEVYSAISQQIRAIFADYASLIEPLSLDEAYLDVTKDLRGLGTARAIAEEIRARIRAETGLTASAGVSYNKFIAKLASDQNKPDGICVVSPAHGPAFVAALPVRRFHGVGPVTAAKMEKMGIQTGADLREQSREFLQARFGKFAAYLYNAARGQDDRPVRSNRPHKSIGAERTFDQDMRERIRIFAALDHVTDAAWARIERYGVRGRTVTLKLRFADFHTITRAQSIAGGIAARESFAQVGRQLLTAQFPLSMGIRLLGLTLSGIIEDTEIAGDAPQPALPFLGIGPATASRKGQTDVTVESLISEASSR